MTAAALLTTALAISWSPGWPPRVARSPAAGLVAFPGWRGLGKGEDNRFIFRPRPRTKPRVYVTRHAVRGCSWGCHPHVKRHMRRHIGAFKHCYEKHALPDNPRLSGSIVPVFWISGSRVVNAFIGSSTLRHRATAACVLKRIRTIRFQDACTDVDPYVAVVRYPLHFKPRPRPRTR